MAYYAECCYISFNAVKLKLYLKNNGVKFNVSGCLDAG